jgi:hypothetical protein
LNSLTFAGLRGKPDGSLFWKMRPALLLTLRRMESCMILKLTSGSAVCSLNPIRLSRGESLDQNPRHSEQLVMRIAQVRRFALSLPEVKEEPHFQYSSFRVRGKIFATVPPEGKHLHVFVSDDEREIALALEPKSLEDLHWGGKVVGLRVLLADAKPKVVNKLLTQAWSRRAPKILMGG